MKYAKLIPLSLVVLSVAAASAETKVGIIGLDTSHSIAFTKAMNVEKLPCVDGFRVVAAHQWGSRDIVSSTNRYPKYIAEMRAMGVEIVPTVDELVEKVDCICLETNDGREHLWQAEKVFKQGKPVFIDKPIAHNLHDARRIYELGRKYGAKYFSSSALRYSSAIAEVAAGKHGKVTGVNYFAPSPAEPQGTHGRYTWYGIHGFEPVVAIMGTGIESVRTVTAGKSDVVTMTWKDGRVAVLRANADDWSYGGYATVEKGKPVALSGYEGYGKLLEQIAAFFRTGVAPVPPEETLEIFAAMEAAELSAKRGGAWVEVERGERRVDGLLALHLDFNTLQFRKETVLALLRQAAADGYNAVLWEIENKVRWECCPEAVAPNSFTKDEFRALLAEAKRLGLEPIPLMQTFGHAEYVLGCEKYRHLRERPERKNCYCPSNPESRKFLKRLLHEYLELFGDDVKRFHLGGDEAYGYGSCAACKPRDAVELYVEHLEAVAEELRARGIRPAVWHDMLKHFDKTCQSFSRLSKDFTIFYWEYFTEYVQKSEAVLSALRHEAAAGREIVVCPSIQCFCDDPFLVRYGMHRANVADMAGVSRRNGFAGLCVTSWSCHSGLKTLQLPLIDFAAIEYRNPSREANWCAVVRKHFGELPAAALDDLTEWDWSMFPIEGRYSDYKDNALPPPDKIEAAVKDERDRKDFADKVRKIIGDTEAGLGAVKGATCELTPMAKLAVEAGELKLAYHRAQLNRILGEAVGEVPLQRTRAFYEREQPADTAWQSTRRTYIPVLKDALEGMSWEK